MENAIDESKLTREKQLIEPTASSTDALTTATTDHLVDSDLTAPLQIQTMPEHTTMVEDTQDMVNKSQQVNTGLFSSMSLVLYDTFIRFNIYNLVVAWHLVGVQLKYGTLMQSRYAMSLESLSGMPIC